MDADPFILLLAASAGLLLAGSGLWLDRWLKRPRAPVLSGQDAAIAQTRDLLKRVRRIEIASRRTVNDQLAGSYHSNFKGRGMSFADVRAYAPGDEVRFIDWNVTARTGHLHVKQFVEERELTVFLAVDLSSSLDFGTRQRTKRQLAAELAAMLAMSAMRNQDKVGLLTFTDRVETFLPPRKGRGQVLRVIREVLTGRARGTRTDFEEPLKWLSTSAKRQAVVFLISDFAGAFAGAPGSPEEKALRAAGRRHDLICMEVTDPLEEKLPDVGLLEVYDAETARRSLVDTSSPSVRTAFERRLHEERASRADRFRRLSLDHLVLSTGADNQAGLVRFFANRARRAVRG
ncbi:MAG: DUF58 domain-containing protein [Deltaproteobacteria bacterium]|nr:DUF58 domain-containing protein [Deltaproteobacteria bacterium]